MLGAPGAFKAILEKAVNLKRLSINGVSLGDSYDFIKSLTSWDEIGSGKFFHPGENAELLFFGSIADASTGIVTKVAGDNLELNSKTLIAIGDSLEQACRILGHEPPDTFDTEDKLSYLLFEPLSLKIWCLASKVSSLELSVLESSVSEETQNSARP